MKRPLLVLLIGTTCAPGASAATDVVRSQGATAPLTPEALLRLIRDLR